jgi:hypothetical protein
LVVRGLGVQARRHGFSQSNSVVDAGIHMNWPDIRI